MAIFKIDTKKVQQLSLKTEGFGNEFNLRDFFAENLEEILGVRFLEKEYPTTDGRIDTLGIDENNSPVIIEYKWHENKEIFTQSLSYLGWLLKNKREFELLVQNKLGKEMDVIWDNPRVILIAQGFDKRTREAAPTHQRVELKTYSLYEGNVLNIENEYSPRPEKKRITKKEKEETEYNLDYHLDIATPEMQKAFLTLQEKLLQLPSVEEVAGQKTGITYRTTKSFTRLEFKGAWIQLLLRDPSYEGDSKGIVRDVTTHRWGFRGVVKFTPESDIDYIFSLVKASYESTL
ncbi:MAG: endonuclease NucS [Candidatus Adlerbacteria bacterium]|nr:endonuclease NucS [Candidatus Adlerbacteria bacterium]